MTDSKPPAQTDKTVASQSTVRPPMPPAPVPPVAKPVAPPLPKPNFSVSNAMAPAAGGNPAPAAGSAGGSQAPLPPRPAQQVQNAPKPPVSPPPQNGQPAQGAQPPQQPRPVSPGQVPQPPRTQAAAPAQNAAPAGTPPKPAVQPQAAQRPPAPLPPRPPQAAQPAQAGQPTQPPRAPIATPGQNLPKPPGQPPMPPRPAPGQNVPKPPTSFPPQAGQPAQQPRPPGGAPASTIRQAPPAPPRPIGSAGGQFPPKPGAIPARGAVPAATPLVAKPIPLDAKTPTGQPPSAGGKPAEMKKSPLRFLPIVIMILVLLGVGFFLFTRFFGAQAPTATNPNGVAATPKPQTVITYWGLWEPTPVLQDTLTQFESENPDIKVNYQQQTYRDYRERLQAAVAGGRGPDVFRYHASWVPMLRAELSEMPSTVYTASEYTSTFYPIASQQLQLDGKYVGIPLMYEGLALVYNQEIFNTANVQPPKTWAELRDLAVRLTIREGTQIRRGGLAIGNASNVDNFSDILGLLMLQNGADPSDPTTQQAKEAIQFYTDFYTVSRVWDSSLPNSTVAFARGDVAMILAPSWRIHEIRNQNPNLTIGVAPVPQLGDSKITWASYWAEGVSEQSKNKDASWKLLKFLSSPEALQKLHSDASKERSFGEIYPRVDMANMLAEDPYSAAYLADAPYAQDWYLNSFTHDNGINDQSIKYYEDAITSLSNGVGNTTTIFATVAQGLLQILRQYNVTR